MIEPVGNRADPYENENSERLKQNIIRSLSGQSSQDTASVQDD